MRFAAIITSVLAPGFANVNDAQARPFLNECLRFVSAKKRVLMGQVVIREITTNVLGG